MRILQVGKFYAPSRGGIETLVLNLSEGLAAAGDSVTVLCSADSNRGTVEDRGDVRVVRAATWAKVFSQPLSPALPAHVMREARRADLVHVHTPNPLVEVTVLGLPRTMPLVVSWHSDIVSQPGLARVYEPLARAFLRRVNAVVVATPHHIRYSPLLGDFSAKCHVIPYGIAHPPALAPDVDPHGTQGRYGSDYLLYVGRLVPYKGVDVLLRAVEQTPRATLVVAGDGPMRGELERQAAGAGMAHRVHFVGSVSDQALAELYRGCSALVLPSVTRAEAFGLVLAEAMSYGKPVISTRLDSGVTLVNLHDVTGLVVPPADPGALSQAISSLLEAPERRARLGEQAQQRFREHYSRDALVTRMRALYARLVA